MLSKLKHWVTLCTNCKLQSQQFPPDVWDTKNHLDNKKSCSAQWWMKDKHLLLNNLTFLFGILQIMANLYIQKGKLKYGHFVQWFHFPIRNIPVYFSTLQMPHKASWAPDQHHTQPQSHIPVFTNISQTERSARPRAANPPAEPKLLSNKHSLLSTPTIGLLGLSQKAPQSPKQFCATPTSCWWQGEQCQAATDKPEKCQSCLRHLKWDYLGFLSKSEAACMLRVRFMKLKAVLVKIGALLRN